MPKRIQLRRTKGWKIPPGTIKVDRSTRFGNRYIINDNPVLHVDGKLHDVSDAATSVRLHLEELQYWASRNPRMVQELLAPLRGKDLACWCKPGEPCHADNYILMANA